MIAFQYMVYDHLVFCISCFGARHACILFIILTEDISPLPNTHFPLHVAVNCIHLYNYKLIYCSILLLLSFNFIICCVQAEEMNITNIFSFRETICAYQWN